MSTVRQRVAVDIGSTAVKLAREVSAADVVPVTFPVTGGTAGALAAAGRGQRHGSICLAVPDTWLDGSVAGTAAQEELRHVAEDVLGLGPVDWVGQLGAVAALSAREQGPGRYLICDLGASGVRAAVVDADGAGGTATVAAHAVAGGWQAFDGRLRAQLGADGRELPDGWYRDAAQEAEPDKERARRVLGRAAARPGYEEMPVYTFTGRGGTTVTAADLIKAFTPVREGLIECLAALTGASRPDSAVLTGGSGWFPLAGLTVASATGITPRTAAPHAAAEGALLFALGEARQASAAPLVVTMPVHRVRGGRLEAADIPLDADRPFTDFSDEPLHLEGDELMLNINGRRQTVPLPGLVAGPHRVGLRRGWAGSALVVRPTGDGPARVAALTARDVR